MAFLACVPTVRGPERVYRFRGLVFVVTRVRNNDPTRVFHLSIVKAGFGFRANVPRLPRVNRREEGSTSKVRLLTRRRIFHYAHMPVREGVRAARRTSVRSRVRYVVLLPNRFLVPRYAFPQEEFPAVGHPHNVDALVAVV